MALIAAVEAICMILRGETMQSGLFLQTISPLSGQSNRVKASVGRTSPQHPLPDY